MAITFLPNALADAVDLKAAGDFVGEERRPAAGPDLRGHVCRQGLLVRDVGAERRYEALV
jgi:hypothetical protein